MPLYEYRCTTCGHRFEKIQSFSAEPEKVCPNCGNATLVRPLTAPRFQFKGAGWYVNDYAPKSSESTSDSPSAEAKPGGESKTSAESKPAESKPSESKTENSTSTPSSTPAPATPSTSSSQSTS